MIRSVFYEGKKMPTDKPMTTVVEYQMRKENTTMEDWLAEWDIRAEDARVGEPETTAYAASINLKDDLNILVFERYAMGHDSLKLHMERPAHSTLIEGMGERRMTKRRVMSFMFPDVSDYGWWGRPDSNDANARDVILVIGAMRFETEAMRNVFIEASGVHADYCWENESDTLIYSGGIASADADREVDLRQGDLVFVMACSDMAAVQAHAADPRHLAMGSELQEKGAEAESLFVRTYKTTGKGFLWR
jgi:hypothetical protein